MESVPPNWASVRGDGLSIHPGSGVVPILKELGNGQLAVIGTGFYITRYGLLATAKHVVEGIRKADELGPAFVAHLHGDSDIVLRRVRRGHLLNGADVAALQLDNYITLDPPDALQNLRAPLTTQVPAPGTPLVTYAYPENKTLDFSLQHGVPTVAGDYFRGGVLRFVEQSEHPFLRFPYLETTVEVRAGASGGPVFLPNGRVFGINCRGWDFRGSDHENEPLSYIAPVALLLDLDVDSFLIPPFSWEAAQLPPRLEGQRIPLRALAELGLINVDDDSPP